MTGTPTWQAATAGQAPLAAHVNQLLATHSTQVLYTGTVQSSQTTTGSGNTTSNGLWMAQSFTTGASQTALGYITARLVPNTSLGANLGPLTVGIYANSAGAPTGSALISTVATAEYGSPGPLDLPIPLPITGLTPSTTYWIVTQPDGNVTFNFHWNRSNQASGASTSTNGTTWTAQTYGFMYQVFDQSIVAPEVFTWEDSGARWTWSGYDTMGHRIFYAEYTAGQTSSGYLQSFRELNYTSNLVSGVV